MQAASLEEALLLADFGNLVLVSAARTNRDLELIEFFLREGRLQVLD